MASGRTLTDAWREMGLMSPHRLFLAHTRAFLIDADLAREGIGEVVDFVHREPEIRRELAQVLVSTTDPRLVLDVPDPLEPCPALRIDRIMRERLVGFHFPRVNLGEFIRLLEAEGADPFAAVVFVQENPSFQDVTWRESSPEPEHNIVIRGTAVFRGDHLAGFLDEGESRGLLWLRGEVQSGQLTMSCPGGDGDISTEIIRSRTRIHPHMRDGRPGFTVQVQVSSRLTEVGCPLDVADPEVVAKLEARQAEVVRNEIERAVRCAGELHSDFPGLGDAFRRRFPHEWRAIRDDWREVYLPEMSLEIVVESRIARAGALFGPHLVGPH